ncbi:MAG: DNA polymerase I [Elusimicrobia bacterium]|nr:DNA polymerase I [Elusimicrobiota bacterium]
MMTKTAEKSLYLVDAHAYLHRAFHALPPLTTKSGEPVGALYGFARMLLGLLKRDKPDFLAVCFDTPEPTFRHKAYAAYKAQRAETDEALKRQLNLAEEMVKAMGLPTAALPGFEADDLMATLAARGVGEGLRVVLVSGDKDALQLVDDKVKVWNEAKGVLFDASKVTEKFKVRPDQLVDYLAIVGDASDNVKGVAGVGPVGAVKLLSKFETLENVIKAAHKGHADIPERVAKALLEGEKAVLEGRGLIRLESAAPIPLTPADCVAATGPTPELAPLFTRLEFWSLLKELGAPAAPPAPVGAVISAPVSAPAAGAPEFAFKSVDPAAFLKAAAKAPLVSIVAEASTQPDLLSEGTPVLALALPDGRAAEFSGPAFTKNRKALAALLAADLPAKLGHDLKQTARLLRGAGLELGGMGGDTYLAAYCLDPGARPDLERLLTSHGAPRGEEGGLAHRAAVLPPLLTALEAELEAAGLTPLYRGLELPARAVLAAMETAGVLVDPAYLEHLHAEFAARITQVLREVEKAAGRALNIASTKQLSEYLYDELKLPVPHETDKGGRSTDEEALTALAPHHQVPRLVLDWREITKLQSTYVDALLAKRDPTDARVRTHYDQAGAATGRLSSSDPNLQNIPVRTPLGRRIRRAFVAGPGSVLLSADYSQIDLRVLAHLSGDRALCDAFAAGGDVHTRTASEVFGVPLDKVDKEMRRRAKAVNFGVVYGQTGHGLSRGLGISRAEAQEFINGYFARYSGVKTWIDQTSAKAKADCAVTTLLGRVRRFPELATKNVRLRMAAERMAVNTPIQGGSADIIKKAMLALHAELSTAKRKGVMLLQVHDELVFEVAKKDAAAFGAWAKGVMEAAVPLKVPVVVDLKAGPNWDEMEPLA